MTSQSDGTAAEKLAEKFLKANGHRLIARNYRTRAGEIDLITRQDDELVFVEVRLRTNRHYGSGAESVTSRKQARIIRTAQQFLQEHVDGTWQSCRFDVVSVDADNRVDWIPAAFTLD